MTIEPGTDRRPAHGRISPSEWLVAVAMLVSLLLSVVTAVTVLALYAGLDHASVVAILGGIGGGAVAALTHLMSSRG